MQWRLVENRYREGISCKVLINPQSFHTYSITPPIRKLVIQLSNYPDQLGSSDKFVENSTKFTCLEITGYRIKYSTVLWFLELQVKRGRKV